MSKREVKPVELTDDESLSEVIKLAILAAMGDSPVIDIVKTDGSNAKMDTRKVPMAFFLGFFIDGCREYVRDSSSGALANAYDVAFPDHELKGDELKTARKTWKGATDANEALVCAESGAIMVGAINRLYKGERRISRMSTVDPMDAWRIKAVRNYMATPDGADVKTGHNAIDSSDQDARREFLRDIATKNAEYFNAEATTLKNEAFARLARTNKAAKGAKITL